MIGRVQATDAGYRHFEAVVRELTEDGDGVIPFFDERGSKLVRLSWDPVGQRLVDKTSFYAATISRAPTDAASTTAWLFAINWQDRPGRLELSPYVAYATLPGFGGRHMTCFRGRLLGDAPAEVTGFTQTGVRDELFDGLAPAFRTMLFAWAEARFGDISPAESAVYAALARAPATLADDMAAVSVRAEPKELLFCSGGK